MEFRAMHGCFGLEKKVGNNYEVDIEMEVDATDAAAEDDVTKTVNYSEVYETVRRQMEIPSDIIENAALRIVDAVYARFPEVQRVEVTVAKLAPPIGGKAARASVTLSR